MASEAMLAFRERFACLPTPTLGLTIGAVDYEVSPHGRSIRVYRKKGDGWRKVQSRREIKMVLEQAGLMKDDGVILNERRVG